MWRHEYGHHVDWNGGRLFVNEDGSGGLPYASRTLVPVMSKDRVSLNSARQKKAAAAHDAEEVSLQSGLRVRICGDGSPAVKDN